MSKIPFEQTPNSQNADSAIDDLRQQEISKLQNWVNIVFKSAEFSQSGSKLSNCPPDRGIEIAFAGRSNAGKSSAINSITENKKLARTSKIPGRTQLINFFALSEPGVRLVDLPGYGFAKVSLDLKAEWGKHLDDYLRNRESLACLVIIVDIRRLLTQFDEMLLEWSKNRSLPVLILLTKSDKLNYGPGKQAVLQLKKELKEHKNLVDVILFSSLKKTGIKECRRALTGRINERMEELSEQYSANLEE
jgi:GTP-binding protein